jgi:hypothetical protein
MYDDFCTRRYTSVLPVLRRGKNRSFRPAEPRAPNFNPVDRETLDRQNAEYAAACAAIEALQEQARVAGERQLRAQREEEERRADEIELVVAKFRSLPPEPDQGAIVAVNLNGTKKMRAFALDELAEALYVWVAGECISAGNPKTPDEFRLRFVGQVINREETLQAQNITGRVILNVSDI